MKEVTGKAVETEISGKFLEECTSGGGFLIQLPSNKGSRKVTLLTPSDELVKVSQPDKDFISPGDVVTAIKDEDGCEFVYENHTTEKGWSFGRGTESARMKAKLAGKAINWLPIVAVVGFLLASANIETAKAIFSLSVLGWLISVGWSLLFYPRHVRSHLRKAEELLDHAKSEHADFIQRAAGERVERLKRAGA